MLWWSSLFYPCKYFLRKQKPNFSSSASSAGASSWSGRESRCSLVIVIVLTDNIIIVVVIITMTNIIFINMATISHHSDDVVVERGKADHFSWSSHSGFSCLWFNSTILSPIFQVWLDYSGDGGFLDLRMSSSRHHFPPSPCPSPSGWGLRHERGVFLHFYIDNALANVTVPIQIQSIVSFYENSHIHIVFRWACITLARPTWCLWPVSWWPLPWSTVGCTTGTFFPAI